MALPTCRQVVVNGLRLWPMVQLVNLNAVPLQLRSLFIEGVSFFWGVYVSAMSGGGGANAGNKAAS